MEQRFILEAQNITKVYPGGVVANHNVNLQIRKGEVHALVGENGAGKSTLMKMLFGMISPTSGKIIVDGKEVHFSSSKDAIKSGLGMVHQHFMLVPSMTVAENLILGAETGSAVKVDRKKAIEITNELSKNYNLKVDAEEKVQDISLAMRQKLEILKALYRGANILILDEPTAVLTPQETEELFEQLKLLRDKGHTIIFISHKLNEVKELCNRMTILRDGKTMGTYDIEDLDENEISRLMVGRDVSLDIEKDNADFGKTIFSVKDISYVDQFGKTKVDNVSFSVKEGQILGVAGIAGSGQKELCETIAGLMPAKKGAILYNKENIVGKSPADIIDLGISMSFVPEDRLGMGLVASMGMVDNMLLKSYKNKKGIFVDRKPAKDLAKKLKDKLKIVTPSIDTPVRLMSGGNVQKVLLGREIESSPNILITAYAVRGLDINSSYTVYDLLNEQKEKGVAVIFIGEDLDVLLELSDRIMVLCQGKITDIVDTKTTTKEELGILMTDQKIGEAQENE